MPDTPDKYEISAPEGGSKEFTDTFKTKSHELGLLPDQVKGLYEWYNGVAKTATEQDSSATNARILEESNALKSTWGNLVEKNMTIAKTAVVEMQKAVPGLKGLVEKVGKEPAFIDLMFQLGKNFMEDEIGNNEAVNQFATMDAEKAQERITAIQADPAYRDKKHPKQKELVQEMFRLNTLISGDRPVNTKPSSIQVGASA